MSTSTETLFRNQLVFREVNERIRELAGRFDISTATIFVCECRRAECVESVELELDEYDAIRSRAGAFVVAAGHEAGAQMLERAAGHSVITVSLRAASSPDRGA